VVLVPHIFKAFECERGKGKKKKKKSLGDFFLGKGGGRGCIAEPFAEKRLSLGSIKKSSPARGLQKIGKVVGREGGEKVVAFLRGAFKKKRLALMACFLSDVRHGRKEETKKASE